MTGFVLAMGTGIFFVNGMLLLLQQRLPPDHEFDCCVFILRRCFWRASNPC